MVAVNFLLDGHFAFKLDFIESFFEVGKGRKINRFGNFSRGNVENTNFFTGVLNSKLFLTI